jgi:hypothetical protein
MRLLRRLVTWGRSPKVQRAVQLAGITFGATCAKNLFEEIYGRLDALEERGLVPLDDLVTIGDVAKIDRRVWVLEGEQGPDPVAVLEGTRHVEEEASAPAEPPAEP